MMAIMSGDRVWAWDDDQGRWREGEIQTLEEDAAEVLVWNGDHPLHPWEATTISVPLDPAFLRVRPDVSRDAG
jgi:hypothetical protein